MLAGGGLCPCMLGPAVHASVRLRPTSDVCSYPEPAHMQQSRLSMISGFTGARCQRMYAVTSTTALHVHSCAVDTARFHIQAAGQLKTLCVPAQLACKCLLVF